VPGLSRRPLRKLTVGDIVGVAKQIEQWKDEASKAGRAITRLLLGYEAGGDGFWIARALREHGIAEDRESDRESARSVRHHRLQSAAEEGAKETGRVALR
jgi:transposase